jgi:hypothetical protein
MATTMQEMHDMLGNMVEKATTMVTTLQKINDKQQDCLYKLEVIAGIRSADVQPSLLPTPSPATSTSMPLPPLPYPPSPQPVVRLVQPPPSEAVGAAEVDDMKATSCGPEPRPAPPPTSLTANAVTICGPEIPLASPSSAPTSAAAAYCSHCQHHDLLWDRDPAAAAATFCSNGCHHCL